MPGSGPLWHLPHLWIKGHVLHRVEGSPAGKHHLTSRSLHLAPTLCHQSSCFIDPSGGIFQRPFPATGAGSLWTRPGGHVCGYQHRVGHGCLGVKGEICLLSKSEIYTGRPLDLFVFGANASYLCCCLIAKSFSSSMRMIILP